MYMLRIEHSVLNYDGWKQAFDSDPVGRKAAGVRRYRVLRGSDKPDHIMIDLEFDTQQQAEALLAGLATTAAGHVIMVTNEVGSGVVPATASGRFFRDQLGRVNARVAGLCSEVYLVVAGRALPLTAPYQEFHG